MRNVVEQLTALGAGRGAPVGLCVSPDGTTGLWYEGTAIPVDGDGPPVVAAIDESVRPRWVVWGPDTAAALVARGVRLATCWDVAAVHRLLAGGWRAEPARVWAWLQGLDRRGMPVLGQLDLLGGDGGGDPDQPVRPDGHLRPEWIAGAWWASPAAAARWAGTAIQAAELQARRLAELRDHGEVQGDPLATARAESTAELLCAELAADGLPVDLPFAASLVESIVAPIPQLEDEIRTHSPDGSKVDLRNPADVKAMLRRLSIDVPDTRAWRLEQLRDVHPVIEPLLRWRKAERIATTFGHLWLATHVGPDGRLRGAWAASDGAAGRMTAQAGLHNMPAELRPIVVAVPGHVFVRADLGQIEPRVLAAVSGDEALRAATQDDDLYAPVAKRLGVERAVAKVAVLAAMYGQTSGTAGQALRGLEQGYPVAMRYLQDAARMGMAGVSPRTYGGRLVRMGDVTDGDHTGSAAAARGRYARNAMVQGAAAELFKVWAVTARARLAAIDARIVLCLHDELLLHVPEERADDAVAGLDACLREAAHRWHPTSGVRFVADTSVVRCWADAKD